MRQCRLTPSMLVFALSLLSACDNAPAGETKSAPEPAAVSAPGTVEAPSSQTVGEAAGEMSDIPDQTDVHSDVPPPSRDVFVDSACDFEGWIGKPVDEAAIKKAGRPYRILKPDDMMTMDHNPERINIEHDGGKVVRIWCG